MRKRTVSSSNLLGAFLGGMLGILSIWYFEPPLAKPLFMLLGVFSGVLIGWWYEDIGMVFVSSYRLGLRLSTDFLNTIQPTAIKTFFGNVRKTVRSHGIATVKKFAWVWHIGSFFGRCLIRLSRWLLHPITLSWIVVALAISFGTLLIGVVLFLGFRSEFGGASVPGFIPANYEPSGFFTLSVFAGVIFFVGGFLKTVRQYSDRGTCLDDFFARWEKWSNQTTRSFFIENLGYFLNGGTALLILAIINTVYWVTLGGILLLGMTIPVATALSFMIGLYGIAKRSGHWWCFGVTLVVTSTSAIVLYSSMDGHLMAWIIALCTGLASAAGTEGLRRLGAWWGETKTGRYYLRVWHNQNKVFPGWIGRATWKGLAKIIAKPNHLLANSLDS